LALSTLLGVALVNDADAGILIPDSLSNRDQVEVVRILGLGTSTRTLNDPWPLGGYRGFEVGLSLETLPAEDLSRLGAGLASPQADASYPKISIGKGLFYDLDVFLQFIPYSPRNELSQFGGLIRRRVWTGRQLPLVATVSFHGNQSNIRNQLTMRSLGADLTLGLTVNNVSLYTQFGLASARGHFVGGPFGLTESSASELQSVDGTHVGLGLVVHSWVPTWPIFAAFQIDRYHINVLSARVGLRI
jgi:hypothetical protein